MPKSILISTEQRFFRVDDDYYVIGDEDYSFFQRYLKVFDSIKIVSRVEVRQEIPENSKVASGGNITFCELKNFIGFKGFISNSFKILSSLWRISDNKNGIFLLRVPGFISILLSFFIQSVFSCSAIFLYPDQRCKEK